MIIDFQLDEHEYPLELICNIFFFAAFARLVLELQGLGDAVGHLEYV